MSEKYYEVETRWGHFRLDEGAYQDYLNNSLWITWTPPWVERPCHVILESEDGKHHMCVTMPVGDAKRVDAILKCVQDTFKRKAEQEKQV